MDELDPAWFSLIHVAVLLAFPVLFVLGDAEESLFLFTGILQISCGIGLGAVCFVLKSRLGPKLNLSTQNWLLNRAVIKDIGSKCITWQMLVSVIGHCGFVLFAWGLLFVNVSTAIILYETRQLFLSLTRTSPSTSTHEPSTSTHEPSTSTHEPLTSTRKWSLFVAANAYVPAIAGIVFVILSHNDTPQPLLAIGDVFTNPETLLGGTLLGVALVLTAALCWSLQRNCANKFSLELAKKHMDRKEGEYKLNDFERMMSAVSFVIAGVFLITIGLIRSETISLHQLFYVIAGALVFSIGAYAIEMPRTFLFMANSTEKSNSKNDEFMPRHAYRAFNFTNVNSVLAVQPLQFAIPLGMLILLWMLSILDVLHLDYLIIGAMGITVSNLLIRNISSECYMWNTNLDLDLVHKRLAYQALMVSLWLFGTIAYITPGFVTDVPLELPVTIFILILAFRVARLVRRTSQEEEWVIEAFHIIQRIRNQVMRNVSVHVNPEQETEIGATLRDASENLLDIDRHRFVNQLIISYKVMVAQLTQAIKYLNDSEFLSSADKQKYEDELMDVRHLVDMLAHSRQQGSRFDETIAIGMVAFLLVLGLLVFNGNSEFYNEFTSFLLSSVVVFLFFNILDLEKDRNKETLQHREGYQYRVRASYDMNQVIPFLGHIVNFESGRNREVQVISVVISVLIIILFSLLFAGVFTPL